MRKYDIYRVNFPFREADGEKNRPALVIAVMGKTVKFLKITTKGKTSEWHYPIIEWEKANLAQPSCIEYEPFYDIDIDKIGEKVRRLSLADIFRLEEFLLYGRKPV